MGAFLTHWFISQMFAADLSWAWLNAETGAQFGFSTSTGPTPPIEPGAPQGVWLPLSQASTPRWSFNVPHIPVYSRQFFDGIIFKGLQCVVARCVFVPLA